MSGQVIGQIVGTVLGTIVGGPIGGAIGGSIGGSIGSSFDSLPTRTGPRLDDLRVQKSEYGAPIPIVYGTAALQGDVIWAPDIKEVKTETEEGGKGGPSQTTVTYSYYGSFAVLLCEGPVNGIGRIWAGPGKRLIWDGTTLESGSLRVYLGTEDQLPDPLIEQDKGVGNTPAYRGYCYIVLEDFALEKDGNVLPFLTVEVGAGGTSCPVPVLQQNGRYLSDPAPQFIGHQPDAKQVFYDSKTGMVYWTRQNANGTWTLNRMNLNTGATGPELTLADHGDLRIAWDNNGGAQYILWGEPTFQIVDLVGWTVVTGIDSTIHADYPDGSGTVSMPIPLSDIAYIGNGQYGYLSMRNSVNTYGTAHSPGIYPVPAQYTWGSSGERYGGDLTPMGIGAAASFQLQPSNYSTKPTQWDLFIGGSHNVLVSFRDGAYTQIGGSLIEMSAPTFGTIQASVYDPVRDMVYAWDAGLGLVAYDPDKLNPVTWLREECIYFDARKPQAYGDGTTPVVTSLYSSLAMLANGEVAVTTWPDGDIFTVSVANKVKAVGALLSDVVADLSERSGESRYDVSQLSSDIVDGYVIARQTQVRAAIDALRPIYYFDAVESQGLIKYVRRGGVAVATIKDMDLAAHDAGGESPDPLQVSRKMEVELPRAITVKYLLAADDYSPAAKQARRLIGASGDEQTIEAPLVLSDAKAQEVAEVNLHAAWAERLSYQFTLPRKYAYLEPTDLIVVKDHLMRLTKISATPRGVLECEAVADETAYYAPHVIVTETKQSESTVSQPGVTMMEIF